MKKLISILMTLTIALSMTVTVMANPVITVTIDGKKIEFDAQPEMVNERTMVPMRAIFEELGAIVSWDQPTQTVTASTATKTVVATIGETSMYVNGEEKVMDVAPYVKDDRTYVPARFIAEALDCRVDWDQSTHTVIISSGVDDEYLYTYNVIKDFVLKNGELDEEVGEWHYSEELKEDTHILIGYYKTGVYMAVVSIGEAMDMYTTLFANRNGMVEAETVMKTPADGGAGMFPGVTDKLLLGFEDGQVIQLLSECEILGEDVMYVFTEICLTMFNEIVVGFDAECSLADFGIPVNQK